MPELVKTEDGSHTLFVSELDEHYHSTFGAVQESRHIFINVGLKSCQEERLTIFEVGFGTGLNAYLTALESLNTKRHIHYITIEKYPIPSGIWEQLNYPRFIPEPNGALFQQLHQAPWSQVVEINEFFTLHKLSTDLLKIDYSNLPKFNLIYFDAFSPEKQPELWGTSIFDALAQHCSVNAKIVTYCAKGEVRRTLKAVGFTPERLPGPPGKREMLRGTITSETIPTQ